MCILFVLLLTCPYLIGFFSCHILHDSLLSQGIDPRVKLVTGMIVRPLYKKTFAMSSDDRCHLVSDDNFSWSCIVLAEWETESASREFVHAIFVPEDLKNEVPQNIFVASKSNGTISYGGKAQFPMEEKPDTNQI